MDCHQMKRGLADYQNPRKEKENDKKTLRAARIRKNHGRTGT